MAYEAGVRTLVDGAPDPGHRHHRHPGRALRPEEALGHAGACARPPRGAPARHRRRPGRAAGRARDRRRRSRPGRRPAGAGGGQRPPGQLRGARLRHALGRRGGGLPGGRRAASRAWALGARRAARSTTSGAWAPSPRPATASRCCSTPTRRATKEALAAPGARHRARDRPTTPPSRPASPTRRPCAALGKAGRVGRAAGERRASSARSATWARPRSGVALAIGLDTAAPGRPRAGARLRRRGGDRPGHRGHRPGARDRHRPRRSRARRFP